MDERDLDGRLQVFPLGGEAGQNACGRGADVAAQGEGVCRFQTDQACGAERSEGGGED